MRYLKHCFHDVSAISLISLLILAVVLGIVVIGPFVTPQNPTDFIDLPFAGRASGEWLGADVLGRDVFSRVLDGGWRIMAMSACAALGGVAAGTLLGVIAGYRGGAVDEAIMRLADVALAFPQLILVLLFVSLLGPKPWLIVLIVGAIHAPQVARTMRAVALRIVSEDYVRHSESIGLSPLQIIRFDVIPNILTLILVELGTRLTFSIAIIAGLSYLSFGAQPPNADWGLMIFENQIGLGSNAWPVAAPVILIAALTVSLNILTDRFARGRRVVKDKTSP